MGIYLFHSISGPRHQPASLPALRWFVHAAGFACSYGSKNNVKEENVPENVTKEYPELLA